MITQDQIFNARILVVDDQKLHALYLERVLHGEGYQNVKCVMNPIQVISITGEFKPDLIVLDMVMPKLDGYQIINQLHSFREEHYLPILAISEDKSSNFRLKTLQAGATDFIHKPYEDIEIQFRIRNMIEMRLLHVEVESQNKILERKVRERTKELRESQLDIIRRLAQAAEFRDNDTGLHIIRMSQYCAKFAESLSFSERECELILNASPLHDVGKIGIPDRILLKAGPLTGDEFEIMKTHTTIGSELLSGSNSPVMKMAQKIALTHHEKWNGQGYPQKLLGDEIPIEGQICSICDVFDALTSKRPYKRAWSIDEAVAELVIQKDVQFNSAMVDKFIMILPQIKDIKSHYAEE